MSERLEIIVARHAGFCMGVRRALDICLEAVNDPVSPCPITTLGPLIHNRQVLDLIEQKGVQVLDEDAPEGAGGTAVIRAHGISPDRHDEIRGTASKIIDATCPHVSKVQNIVKKYSSLGYKCIIVGDPGHAEVEGVVSFAGGAGMVVSGPDSVASLGHIEKAVVVAQTTQNEAVFDTIASLVRDKCDECLVFDTICRATQERQNEAVEMACKVDAMVVVGGHNSANTCRLAAVCADAGTPVFQVETEDELSVEEILKFRRIGVTAGASTPNWMIKRVVGRLYRADEERNRPLTLLLKRIINIPVRTNAWLGGGAASMTYVAFTLLGLPSDGLVLSMALAFCFITSQHLLHQYTKRKAMLLNEPERGEFFEKHTGMLLLMAAVAAMLAFGFSLWLGLWPFTLVLLGMVGGVLYCMPERTGSAFAGLDRIRRLTGSKEFFVALAWSTTTALIPFLSAHRGGVSGSLIVVALFVGLMAFHRTLLTDMRDFEGDQLIGRETIAVAFGRRTAKRILVLITLLQLSLLFFALVVGWIPFTGYVMLFAPCYSVFVNGMYLKNKLPAGESGEAIVDAGFYLAGLLALLGVGMPVL